MHDDERARDVYRDRTITHVGVDDTGWSLGFDDGDGTWLPTEDFDPDILPDVEPKLGDTLRLYGPGYGDDLHGVDLNGRRLWYRTKWDRLMRQQVLQVERALHLRAVFERDRGTLDAAVAALSPPLRARIERFRAENSDFRWMLEASEVVVCAYADRIVAYLRRRHGWDELAPASEAQEAVEALRGLPWYELRTRIPELESSHVGETLDASCALALALLTGRHV